MLWIIAYSIDKYSLIWVYIYIYIYEEYFKYFKISVTFRVDIIFLPFGIFWELCNDHIIVWKKELFIIFLKIVFILRERELSCVSTCEQEEKQKERKGITSRFPTECRAQLGLNPTTLRSWPECETKSPCSMDWATLVPPPQSNYLKIKSERFYIFHILLN